MRALGRIDPTIDLQGVHHPSGFYIGKVGHETFIFVQDAPKTHPIFPNVRDSSQLWDKIKMKDIRETDIFILRIEHIRSRARGTKRSKSNNLDIQVKYDKLEYKATQEA